MCIKNDGTVEFYCSSKCRKNATKLHRDKKKFKWTAAFHEQKQRLADHLAKKAHEATQQKEAPVARSERQTKKAKKQ